MLLPRFSTTVNIPHWEGAVKADEGVGVQQVGRDY